MWIRFIEKFLSIYANLKHFNGYAAEEDSMGFKSKQRQNGWLAGWCMFNIQNKPKSNMRK